MPKHTLPPATYLRECFDYNRSTGIIKWKARPRDHFKSEGGWRSFNTRYAGKPTGCPLGARRYLVIGIDGRNYYAHRIAWMIVTGEEPIEIDHRNCNPGDNRWSNLREATGQQNKRNISIPRGVAGLKGVWLDKRSGRYGAAIVVSGKTIWLGAFGDAQSAHAAYRKAAQELFGEFANPGHDTRS